MKNFSYLLFLAMLFSATVFSQNKKEVLLTIEGEPVYANEFERVYKKNLDLVQDESQKDIDSYLKLFIDYKLKIAEAKAQKLDQQETYKSELMQYRDQLSRNYIFEDKVTENLAKEAYERGKEEIKAAHILIQVNYDDVPQDTLAAYNKIKMIREKALKGEDFNELAKTYSEEPGAKETGGDLGYFSVFSMVYPFESAAYNTKVGDVSEIVRSRFGYHIIKVKDRRKKLPPIEVSHIMISDKKDGRDIDAKERINEIYAKLKQGENFESLAKQFSDDKNSAVKGGKLKSFSKGELRSTDFENAAYKLDKVGEISKPVKSDFGWHIIRLDQKMPEQTWEEQMETLEKKVGDGDRSKVVANAVNSTIKQKYGFKKVNGFSPFFENYVSEDVLNRKWKMEHIPAKDDKIMFTIGNAEYRYSDFARYIENRQHSLRSYKKVEIFLTYVYDEFETKMLKDYFMQQLENENEDYAAILGEYRDGLLIFDVMNKNIWEKAKNDSVGLQKYYDQNKDTYKWKQRVDADIFSANSTAIAQRAKEMLESGKSAEEVKTSLNTDNKVNVINTQGVFEIDQRELPQNLDVKKGVSKIYSSNESFVVVNIKEVIPAGIKELDEVKGRVLSNYQNDLEAKWMEKLHNNYKVEVNKKTLKHLKKDIK